MKIISASLLCAWVGVLALGVALPPAANATPAIPDDVRYVAGPNCASQSDQSYFDGLGGGFDGCPPIAPAKLDPNAVCSLLSTGYSQVDVAERLEVGNPNLNFDNAEQYVAGIAPTCSVANSGQASPPNAVNNAPSVGVTGVPDAHADSLGEQKFIRDMAARGVVGRPTDQDLINSGYDVCRMLGNGTAKNAVVNTIAEQSLQSPLNHSGGGVSQQQALLFVNAAWVDLCPSLNVPDM